MLSKELSKLEMEAKEQRIPHKTLNQLIKEYKQITGKEKPPKSFVELIEVAVC